MSIWERVARYCQEVYGAYIDWEEEFYECPECGEPVYKVDYNEMGDYYTIDGEGPICPVCEFLFEEDE